MSTCTTKMYLNCFAKTIKKKQLKNGGSQTQSPDKCDMKHG